MSLHDEYLFNKAGLMGAAQAFDASPRGERDGGEFNKQQSDFLAALNDGAAEPVDAGAKYGENLQQDYFFF